MPKSGSLYEPKKLMLQESSSVLTFPSNTVCEKKPLNSICLNPAASSSSNSPPSEFFLVHEENKQTTKKKFAENNKVFRKIVPEKNKGIFYSTKAGVSSSIEL
jgi:hypothetical protein